MWLYPQVILRLSRVEFLKTLQIAIPVKCNLSYVNHKNCQPCSTFSIRNVFLYICIFHV